MTRSRGCWHESPAASRAGEPMTRLAEMYIDVSGRLQRAQIDNQGA